MRDRKSAVRSDRPAPLHHAENRIATVGIELFSTRGFDETSVDDIAEAAGHRPAHLFPLLPVQERGRRGATSTANSNGCGDDSRSPAETIRSSTRSPPHYSTSTLFRHPRTSGTATAWN